jgi:cobalamin-dependent methionine synthase I
MKEVGDKFGAGELILPFVLQSAETMKKTVSHLENYLEKWKVSPRELSSSRPSTAMCMTSAKI